MSSAAAAAPPAAPTPRYLGMPVRRKEDPRLLRGEGVYVADVQVPGQLYAAFVRSPYVHARILRLDLAPVRCLPVVVSDLVFSELDDLA